LAQNGTAVQVYDRNGTSGQTWALLSGGIQGFQLQDGNGECLDEGSGAASGTKVGLGVCNSTGANQTWCMDGTGALFNCVSHLYVTAPSVSPLTQLALSGPLPTSAYATLSNSNHNLLVGAEVCVGPQNAGGLSTPVIAYGCNALTLETWFARPVGGSCPGTVASNGTCNTCGGNNQLPCTTGCNPGVVSAVPPGGVGTICVSACGNVGEYLCSTNGCTGGCYGLGTAQIAAGPCSAG
jgi:Ricin-type beta-trefoil lectin domain